MQIVSHPKVESIFKDYPKSVSQQTLYFRELVIRTASEVQGLEKIEETLKRSEPSCVTK